MNGHLRAKGHRYGVLTPSSRLTGTAANPAASLCLPRSGAPHRAHLGASLGDWTAADLGTIAQLRHAFLFGAMSTAKDRAVFFNPVADDVRATMRACRCEGLNCTFKAVKGVGAAV